MRSGAIMTTSFVMKLKEECHTSTDGVTGQNLFPSIWVHPSWHANKGAWGNAEQKSMPTPLSDDKTLYKNSFLGRCIGGLLARVPYIARYPIKDNHFPCLMQLKHLLLNFDNEQKLWCISMETLEGTL
jgi:hypothetical protein